VTSAEGLDDVDHSIKLYRELLEKNPERAVEKAVRGMLPKTSLGRAQMRKLKVYTGAEHPHAAQQPTPYILDQVAQ
jgi:large subunit ribosomal protein L13